MLHDKIIAVVSSEAKSLRVVKWVRVIEGNCFEGSVSLSMYIFLLCIFFVDACGAVFHGPPLVLKVVLASPEFVRENVKYLAGYIVLGHSHLNVCNNMIFWLYEEGKGNYNDRPEYIIKSSKKSK